MAFDSSTIIEVRARSEAGLANLELRWPTDEEWILRAKGRKVISHRQARGQVESRIEAGDSDQKLYEKIKLNGGPALGPVEAARVIDAIALCEITDVEIAGNEATVSLEVVSGQVQQVMRLPSAEEVLSFRRAGHRLIELPNNRWELRQTPEAGGRLWDACQGRGIDYTSAVPVLHKDLAIRAVIEFLDREVSVKRDESSF